MKLVQLIPFSRQSGQKQKNKANLGKERWQKLKQRNILSWFFTVGGMFMTSEKSRKVGLVSIYSKIVSNKIGGGELIDYK